MFEPFYRGENKKLKVRGLGLGLPFSKMLAKAQKGDLVLKDSNEQGTIFTIVIEKRIKYKKGCPGNGQPSYYAEC
ncbi:ATP-binding protein [[Brevibacterium] frigoritolerans]|uniref:ATP-binding protein n=1 Tax=Peribacillus frigoritolerans TaxID=450367 RepID=A0A941FGL5_9BACI|nr:ATP-binding protein [Peribacillus frigoritolerans]